MPVVLALVFCLVSAAAPAQPLVHNNTREVIRIAPDVYQLVCPR